MWVCTCIEVRKLVPFQLQVAELSEKEEMKFEQIDG